MSTADSTSPGPDRSAGPDLLVIGGTGFLGRELVATAMADGRSVAATYLTGTPDATVEWHRLDLADGGGTAATLIEKLRPRAVINAAYVQKGADLHTITAIAPGAIAAATSATSCRLVHLSSDVVFDGTTTRPYTEDDRPAPVYDYGRAKARAEQLVVAADATAVIVRTSLLWSQTGDGGPQMHLVRDRDVSFFTDEVRNPLRVDRLARACLELADRSEIHGLLHVAGADAIDRLAFARHLAPLAGRDPGELRGGAGDPDAARPRNCPLDSSRACRLLTAPLPGVAADRFG